VLRDVDTDIQAFVEVANRIALKTFPDTILPREGGIPFEQVTLIDGTDERDIDVAIGTANRDRLATMRSHVDGAA
jgi:hypothetical protein